MNPAMPLDYLVSALVTLLVVVDPVGLTPAFLAVTHGLPAAARKRIAFRACLIAAAILAGTALIGDWLLGTLAITLPAFRIAGGLLLFAVASEMVFGERIERQSRQAEEAIEEHVRHVAAFPLAIPLMAGPGAITATLLLAGQARGQPLLLAGLLGVIMVVVAVCLGVFLIANRIEKSTGFGHSRKILFSRIRYKTRVGQLEQSVDLISSIDIGHREAAGRRKRSSVVLPRFSVCAESRRDITRLRRVSCSFVGFAGVFKVICEDRVFGFATSTRVGRLDGPGDEAM